VGFLSRGICVPAFVSLSLIAFVASPANAGTVPVYFVVAERPGVEEHGDSFVLPLTDAVDVAHARDLIARGPEAAGAAIVFAEISAGADGVNRDVLAAGEPLWNWHVSRFEGFGDVGLELVDGWPTFVEQDVQGWIANTRRSEDETFGHIGFWNYTVVAELAGDGVTIPLPAALPVGAGGVVAIITLSLGRTWKGRGR
jgi:hypothetical protein